MKHDLETLASEYSSTYVIIDERVAALHPDLINWLPSEHVYTVPQGEACKNPEVALGCWEWLLSEHIERSSLIIGIGGGATCDLAGFVATTVLRGVALAFVPTTLLAMVDAAIGGKNGVNLEAGKNLVGTLRQPEHLLWDVALLQTLSERQLRSGFAEVAKYGAILDPTILEQLRQDGVALEPLIERCQELKRMVVEKDEREGSGYRDILNFGHTFAHAFERIAGYGELLHGEAVSMGMVCALRLGEQLGITEPGLSDSMVETLQELNLPTAWYGRDPIAVLDAMRTDKKRLRGSLRFILVERWGSCRIGVQVPEDTVAEVLAPQLEGASV